LSGKAASPRRSPPVAPGRYQIGVIGLALGSAVGRFGNAVTVVIE
jgi:hypothetical protein